MFTEEAKWIENVLKDINPFNSNNKAANLGSSTETFRKNVQPHIDAHIILPLEKNGWQLFHIDYKKENGVDIVADLTDKEFGKKYKNNFSLTICTNMLEHVENIAVAADNLFSVTADQGYILITVPYKYKIHQDPIDNGFRPKPEEIVNLFSPKNVKSLKASVIIILDKKYYKIKKSRIPLWGYRERWMYFFGKRHKVSGVLLQVHK